MLVLNRFVGETICIDKEIEIEILGIHGNKIKLGITAPPHVTVHRAEVKHRIEIEGPKKKQK